MGCPTRRATAKFQTFAVEVLNSFWLVVDVVEEQMMLIMRLTYIIYIRVKLEKETHFRIIPSTLHLQIPPKAAHLGSSGDGVIVWGLEEACTRTPGGALAWKVGL